MWGYVLGAIGVGIALYELWTRPTAAEIAAAAKTPATAGNFGIVRLNQTRAQQCGLQARDFADTDNWSRSYFPATVQVVARLELMKSAIAPALWPAHARRTHCYLIGPLPPVPGEVIQDGAARPIQDAPWPGH